MGELLASRQSIQPELLGSDSPLPPDETRNVLMYEGVIAREYEGVARSGLFESWGCPRDHSTPMTFA